MEAMFDTAGHQLWTTSAAAQEPASAGSEASTTAFTPAASAADFDPGFAADNTGAGAASAHRLPHPSPPPAAAAPTHGSFLSPFAPLSQRQLTIRAASLESQLQALLTGAGGTPAAPSLAPRGTVNAAAAVTAVAAEPPLILPSPQRTRGASDGGLCGNGGASWTAVRLTDEPGDKQQQQLPLSLQLPGGATANSQIGSPQGPFQNHHAFRGLASQSAPPPPRSSSSTLLRSASGAPVRRLGSKVLLAAAPSVVAAGSTGGGTEAGTEAAELENSRLVACHAISGPALLSEYLTGNSIRSALRRHWWVKSPMARIKVALDAAQGMDYLHSRGVVHLNLKTGNLLVGFSEKQPSCKAPHPPHDMPRATVANMPSCAMR
ncbi:hypothetical protein VOLCADRAFT_99787 [Volvox carteri f. nagariensis]|uniref:Serine-threonine/tyrosine-protein kinase catalytic domain-containing protein n=1 Tax=Volvox carteri f. nagariensis TaxID=3068 RepID=D8UIN0_VOLCA|nr:uncharacterized protein VOLCADRAFT_99787 [Volvox carteri f. nagariensis]EFJ40441.1 hypothetical protein VOLCADRAFT_99787 [Volvox carteri f. nagariensis]|eukprot:XP_002958521.1 hypothetical protein VOLCADRAFT_99787 [Volvox carteri f. nagariensis]